MERGVNTVGAMAVSAIKALEALGVSVGDECARAPVPLTLADLEAAGRIAALKQDEPLPLLQERFSVWAE